MKRVRVLPKPIDSNRKRGANTSNTFVFCEKSTGATRFHAESSSDLNYSVERMASMLAIQCLVRGSDPADFAILVPAEESFAGRLVSRAKELLAEGRAAGPASLSPRQREILQSVVRNRANKEIAWNLNISVRTVKFHISSLLSKFRVTNRSELAQKAEGFLRPDLNDVESSEREPPSSKILSSKKVGPLGLRDTLQIENKARNVRFPQRILTA